MTSIIDNGPRAEADASPAIDTAAAKRAYGLDRKHVFHSWSAQDLLDPMVVSAAQGSLGVGRGGEQVPRFLLTVGEH